jgi:hypothetical protein
MTNPSGKDQFGGDEKKVHMVSGFAKERIVVRDAGSQLQHVAFGNRADV